MPVDDLLKAGIIAYQLEDLPLARSCLSRSVAADPKNASAWLWLGRCLDDPEQKRYCFQQAVKLEGDNLTARQALEDLDRQPAVPPPPRSLVAEEIFPDVQPQAIIQATEAPTREIHYVAASPDVTPAAAPPAARKHIRFSRGLLIAGVGVALVACTAIIVLLVLPRLGGSALPAAPTATLPVVLPTATQTMTQTMTQTVRPSITPFPATWTMTATLTRRPTITPLPTATQMFLSVEQMHATLTAIAAEKTSIAAPPSLTPEPPKATVKPGG